MFRNGITTVLKVIKGVSRRLPTWRSCHLDVSLWIFLVIITVLYIHKCKYTLMTGDEDENATKICIRTCNPAKSIVRGSEGVVHSVWWQLTGVVVVTRHGDRGPLASPRGGERLPCGSRPASRLLDSYEQFAAAANFSARDFPHYRLLPAAAARCAAGQLTPRGVLQMIAVGRILKDAYASKLLLRYQKQAENVVGEVMLISTQVLRAYQSMLGAAWGLAGARAERLAAAARGSHATTFCTPHCGCARHRALSDKFVLFTKNRLQSRPTMKSLVYKLSSVLFGSKRRPDAQTVADTLLAYLCHGAPLPCASPLGNIVNKNKNIPSPHLLEVLNDELNMESQYINDKDLDFKNKVRRRARHTVSKNYFGNKNKPVHIDAQQIHSGNKSYASLEESSKEFCINENHVMALDEYLAWSYGQEIKSANYRRSGLLVAYGLLHDIMLNIKRMVFEGKPKLVLYSGHDTTLRPLILSLCVDDYQHYKIQYASRLIFEVYKKNYRTDEFREVSELQDSYFRVIYNGVDITDKLRCCPKERVVNFTSLNPADYTKTYLCPVKNIVTYVYDDYFTPFGVNSFEDACAMHNF